MIVGPLVASIFLGSGVSNNLTWRLLLGLCAIPGLAVFYLRRQIHETPRFAMAGGAAEEAQAAISAATGGKPAVSTAVESKARHSQSVASGYLKLFQNRRLLIWLIGTAGGWALAEAEAHEDGRVTAVFSWQVPFVGFPGAFDRAELEQSAKDFLVERVSAVVPTPKVPLTPLVAQGDPAEALVAASKEADHLVVE